MHVTSNSFSSMVLSASLRSASKPTSPVTYARRPVSSPEGDGTIERIVAAAASAVCVLSSVIAAAASATLESGDVNRPGPPGLRSSGSWLPQARP